MTFKKFILCAATVLGLSLSSMSQQGVINTIVGGGPSNMPAVNANLNAPNELAFDAQGNYYFANPGNNQVFKVNPSTGVLTLVAGNGIAGFTGDGGPAVLAELSGPFGVAVDGSNPANVYIADQNNCAVRVVNQNTGIITTLNTPQTCRGGDGGPASLAGIEPFVLTFNPLNNDLYIADFGEGIPLIRKIAGGVASGTITTVAGNSANGNCGGTAPFGDGGSATGTNVTFCFTGSFTGGIALDTSVTPPNILISDQGRCAVREVIGATSKIYRVAGSYTLGCGYSATTTATGSQFFDPTQLQVQVSGGVETVTVADAFNEVIRQFPITITSNVPSSGKPTVFAGTPSSAGMGGDGGLATSALLNVPQGVVFDAFGDLFIADTNNERIREVNHSTLNINTVAGYSLVSNTPGETAFDNPLSNNNLLGSGVALDAPVGVFVNPTTNNLLIGGSSDNTVHELLHSTNEVNTLTGNGIAGYAGDGNAASDPGTELNFPQGVAQDSNGNTYIADASNSVVRMVSPAGTITTFAGGSNDVSNSCGFLGDGEAATAAALCTPRGVAADANNNVYIADGFNLIREVSAGTGIINTVAGNFSLGAGYSGDGGLATNAQLNNPYAVAVDGAGNFYIADLSNFRIRRVDAASHIITTVAGNGTNGFTGDGPGNENALSVPQGVAADVNGNIFISDTGNQILRWVDPAGTMLTFGGNRNMVCVFAGGDGGSALLAGLCNPSGISVDASGNIFFADSSDNRIREVNAFAGIGRSTGSLTFGLEPVGATTTNPQEVVLSAIGPTTINSITTTGDFSEVDNCPANLTAGQTCQVDVFFSPTTSGIRAGSVIISDNGLLSQTQTVNLQGTGQGLSLSGTLAFGPHEILTPSPTAKTVTLKNAGAVAVTINSIMLTETTDFKLGAGTCPNSGSLGAKKSCTIIVNFNPQSIGAKKGTLVVSTNDPSSPLLLVTTGTGTSFESFTPTSVAFATPQLVNTSSAAKKVTFKYTGTGTLTLNSLTPSANYSVNTTGIPTGACNLAGTTSLPANQSCSFNVVFAPTTIGGIPGTVTASFTGDPNSITSAVLQLSGTGTEVQVATTLKFGTIPHGTATSLNLNVTNVSATNTLHVTNTSITGTDASVYLVTSNTCASVGPGLSCAITVQFNPPVVGSFPATLTLTTDGGNNPVVNLTGSGS